MASKLRFAFFAAAAVAAVPVMGAPLDEIIGQPVDVSVDGVHNTLYFAQDGSVRVVTTGGKTVMGTWAMQGTNVCMNVGGANECWPYHMFEAQQPQTLMSSCNAQSIWTAQATNMQQQPMGKGERGR